jgi:beta-phosphoglucomutase-like phosphatase (HAD superfamily)
VTLACRALVFDMDGLMVDSEPLWFEVEQEFARSRGGDFTKDLAQACVGRGMAHTLGVMRDQLGVDVDVERDAAVIVNLFVARVGELSLKPGFSELFEEACARGIPRAVASSSARRLVDATLARFGLLPRFDAVVTGDCVKRHKPAPDVFLEAARRLGVDVGGCVVLEDSHSGVVAARAAGMRVIAVPEAEHASFEPLADSVVADLHEARARISFA